MAGKPLENKIISGSIFMKNTVILILFALTTLYHPGKGADTHSHFISESKPRLPKEGFKDFFIKFNNDSVFQRSRILFPLKNDLLNNDYNAFKLTVINREAWTHINFEALPAGHKLKKKKGENGEKLIIIQKKETGLNVTYHFKKRRGKWFLIKIVDTST